MSVKTTADEHRDIAFEQIEKGIDLLNDAQQNLQTMIDEDTWGGDKWNRQFVDEVFEDIFFIQEQVLELKKLKRKYK